MKRIAWLTDIHLNLLLPGQVERFLAEVRGHRPDAVLIGGDISESPRLVEHLIVLRDGLPCPIYFVLGNHDYFRGTIGDVRRAVSVLCREEPNLVWLTESEPIELTPSVGLVGHDGWADARLGDYERSLVMMLDYSLIGEFAGLDKRRRWDLLQLLADDAAHAARGPLLAALARYRHVFFLTHVPPFRDACWYNGQISNDEWLPHFTSKAMGEMLLEVMERNPQRQLTVLCGHTHGRGRCRPADNIEVLTGGAHYGTPEVQRVFELE